MPEEQKSLVKKFDARFDEMARVRLPYEEKWQEVIELFMPGLSRWYNSNDETNPGDKRNFTVYNDSPQEALQTSADGMQGLLASASLDWFKYEMADKELNDIPEVRAWLQQVEEIAYSLFADSNFYSVLNRVFLNVLGLGNGCMFIDTNRNGDGIACSTFHPREVYITEDSNEVVSGFAREFSLPISNAIDFFGKNDLSESLVLNAEKKPLETARFRHGIFRRDDMMFDREMSLPDREWISMYTEVGAKALEPKPLRVAGYFSYPAPFWRLNKVSDSLYGWGLGCSSLVSAYGLNAATFINMRQGQLAVDPTIKASASLKGRLDVMPHGRIWMEPGEEAEAMISGINYSVGLDREERLQIAIDKRFNVDFFLMLNRAVHPISPEELAEKVGERSVLLGPKIGTFNHDLGDPIHDRIIELAFLNDWLPEPPAILQELGARFDVKYVGPLAQAQRDLFETRRSQRALAKAVPWFELLPETIDNLEGDISVRRIMRDGGHPENEIKDEDKRDAQREAKQQAIERDKQLAIGVEVGKLPGAAPEPGSPQEVAMR